MLRPRRRAGSSEQPACRSGAETRRAGVGWSRGGAAAAVFLSFDAVGVRSPAPAPFGVPDAPGASRIVAGACPAETSAAPVSSRCGPLFGRAEEVRSGGSVRAAAKGGAPAGSSRAFCAWLCLLRSWRVCRRAGSEWRPYGCIFRGRLLAVVAWASRLAHAAAPTVGGGGWPRLLRSAAGHRGVLPLWVARCFAGCLGRWLNASFAFLYTTSWTK